MKKITQKKIALEKSDPRAGQKLDVWYQDSIESVQGNGIRIKIKNILCHTRSQYQEIVILDTEKLGKVLVIDGITMLTEFDEFAYHEMISHVPLLVHPKPARVLIIGGGDGGVVREVLKHRLVETVHVCEIDPEVVRVCKQHLPALASSFDDPRVEIFCEDGARFVSKKRAFYDIIIVDSTDPVGPGQILFQEPFYRKLSRALTRDGIAVTQCESIFLHRHVIRGVFSFARKIFPKLGYYYTLVPTYPSGVIGFFFCSRAYDPSGPLDEGRIARLRDLKYYSPEIHRASFALPRFAAEIFEP